MIVRSKDRFLRFLTETIDDFEREIGETEEALTALREVKRRFESGECGIRKDKELVDAVVNKFVGQG